MVGHEHLRLGHEINIAVDTAEVPHVLSLEIAAVAPAIDAHRELVLACGDVACEVKLRVGISALREAYILSVDPDDGGAIETVKVKKYALAVPTVGQGERAAIEAGGVVVGNAILRESLAGHAEGSALERIAHIGVDGLAIVGHLP